MSICQYSDGQPINVRAMPESEGGISNPRLDDLIPSGWREYAPSAELHIKTAHWEDDGRTVRQIVDAVWTQAELDQQAADQAAADAAAAAAQAAADAAAQAAYLEGVDVLPRPIRGIVETDGGDGHVYAVTVDGAGGEVIPIQRESTRLTNAELEAAMAAARTERQQHRTRLDGIKTDLDQTETALDQIDATMAGPLGVLLTALDGLNLTPSGDLGMSIAALPAGQTKTALQEVRKAMVTVRDGAVTIGNESRKIHDDTKTAAKNLRQAAEKVRREIK
jgi:hypothetical protein